MPSYTPESLADTLAAVNAGLGKRTASRKWKIPITTLRARLNGQRQSRSSAALARESKRRQRLQHDDVLHRQRQKVSAEIPATMLAVWPLWMPSMVIHGPTPVTDITEQAAVATASPTSFHWQSQQLFYRVPVTVPYNAPILVCVQNGDIYGMRELWKSGKASVDTVNPYGLGLLYYSAYYCWRSCGMSKALAICQALLQAGANSEWMDERANTPLQTMIESLLVESASSCLDFHSALDSIAQIFVMSRIEIWREYKDSRGFTELHHVLLRIDSTYGTLENYLEHATTCGTISELIDGADAFGKTALCWAVEHGWTDAVETLIKFGSNVNQRVWSIYGGSPILHLALAGPACGRDEAAFLEIVKRLLLAGADVNGVDHEGWTPLHIAASWDSYTAISTLSECAGSLLGWNIVTADGKSAAQIALDHGAGPVVVQALVERGSWLPDWNS